MRPERIYRKDTCIVVVGDAGALEAEGLEAALEALGQGAEGEEVGEDGAESWQV